MATSRKKKPVESTKKDEKSYTLCISFNDTDAVTDTTDLVQAFLDLAPQKITTKVLIRVEQGDKKLERWMYPARARVFFRKPIFIEMYVKQLKAALG